MSSKKLAKKVLITTLSASMVLPFGSAVYANTQALPNGTIVTENGVGYLKDSNGEKYSVKCYTNVVTVVANKI